MAFGEGKMALERLMLTETARILEEKLVFGLQHELAQLIGEFPRDDMESGALVFRRGNDPPRL